MTLPISIFIIAHNEADRIGRTIKAIRNLTDDVIVIDSGSADGTEGIAESLGARVVCNPWPGYGLQKRFGEDQCRYEWRFNLDADEVATADLCKEMRALFVHGPPQPGAYTVRIFDMLPGDRKPHAFARRHTRIRLYHTNAGRYSVSTVHDLVHVGPGVRVSHLRGKIHHFSILTLGLEIEKFNTYTDALAADFDLRNARRPVWRVFLEFPVAFLKAYFIRLYFMRGTYGFLMAMNYAFFRHLRIAKYYERRYLNKRA